MTVTVDIPPLHVPIVGKDGKLTQDWLTWFSTLQSNLVDLFTQYGLQLPQVPGSVFNQVISPPNGTIFHNTTIGEPQILINGVLRTFLFA